MSIAADVIHTAVEMNHSGINSGSSGNVSARHPDGFLITPTGMAYGDLEDTDLVLMSLSGAVAGGLRRPSTEWQFHRDIYVSRPEFGAVVHVHSRAATALACLRQPIPAFHYMVAVAGGVDIRCSDYALFGTRALSAAVIAALEQRRACLLANHGLVACGVDLQDALQLAIEVELLASQYLLAQQSGEPVLLTTEQMAEVLARFADYGQQRGEGRITGI